MKDESKSPINDVVNMYFDMFLSFLAKTKDKERAYRLSRDMFEVMMKSAQKNDSLSIFWDRGDE